MTATQWNDEEDAAMDYLPHVDQIIYLRGIRRRMDYQTGIAGMAAHISYEWLSQLAEVHPRRGSNIKEPPRLTKEALRAVFARLEGAGLVERVRDAGGRGLVFRCLKASLDQSASRRNNPSTTPAQPQQHNPATFSHTDNSGEMSNPSTTPAQPQRHNPIQVSGFREESEANASLCGAAKKSRFAEFWDAWPSGQRKRDRHKAEQAWKRLKLDDQADMIIADIKRRATDDQQWLRGYAPMPTTYINGKRWEDEFDAPQRTGKLNGKASVADHNRLALDSWLNADDTRKTADIIEGEFIRESV